MDSQLFGHRKGSFTGAISDQAGLLGAVDDGTLFMDEVTTMDISLQAKLLRVLQEREYSEIGSVHPIPFREQVLSASQLPLEQAVRDGTFRADLRYRLEVINIHLPPLRERSSDILPLFRKFLSDTKSAAVGITKGAAAMDGNRAIKSPYQVVISAEAIEALTKCDWPGNIRQLQNSALYAMAMSDGIKIEISDLPADVGRYADKSDENSKRAGDQGVGHGRRASDFSRRARDQRPSRRKNDSNKGVSEMSQEELLAALASHEGSRVRTALSLGVSRMTLWRAMKKQGIS